MSPEKFSTRRLTTLAVAACLSIGGACLTAPAPTMAQTVAQTTAQTAGPAGTPPIELAPGAPDKHVVVAGDTLWAISATFLKSPWRWPEVWQLNREQIANPHLIYPGEIVYLDTSGASPRLRLGRPVGGMTAGGQAGDGSRRLEPMVRAQHLDQDAIATVSSTAIAAFVNRPLIVDEKGLADAPRIVATQEGRVYLGSGDRAYVRGIKEEGVSRWHVYRPARPLLDPDTRLPLAYEATFLGTAQVIRRGDPTTVVIVDNGEEIGEGDRLVPAEPTQAISFVPRPPDTEVSGRIISVYRGISQVGKNSVVAVNLGRQHGLDVGHVLSVQLTGAMAKDRQTNELIKLPNEPIGQLLVFRTFDTISYGLIVDASQAISVGYLVANP